MSFTDADRCCVPRCQMPVVLRYSVHPDGRSCLLCDRHWARLSKAETVPVWNALLKQMGYSPKAIRWWIARIQGVLKTRDSQDGDPANMKEPEMAKSKKVATPKKKKVGETWRELLVTNEKAKKPERKTDFQLHKEMNQLFPGRTSYEFTDVGGVQQIRRYYNNGGWNDGKPPKLQSHRFDKTGEISPVVRGRQSAAVAATTKPSKKSSKKTKKVTRKTAPIG